MAPVYENWVPEQGHAAGPALLSGAHRLVLVTGKGGVGKTTTTAALVRAAHASGRRVLAAEISSELGHVSPLMTHFGRPSVEGAEPVSLAQNLWGVRITPSTGHKLFLQSALKLRMLVDAAMKSSALHRFLRAAPAFPEIGTLYHLVSLLRDPRFDLVVVDLPATGHALGLASLPRVVLRVVRRGVISETIREGLDVLTDHQKTMAVVVTIPEALPVTEACELVEGLEASGIGVGGMVLNMAPEDPMAPDEWTTLLDWLKTTSDDRWPLGTRQALRLRRALDAAAEFERVKPEGHPGVRIPQIAGASWEIARSMSASFMAAPLPGVSS